MMIREPAETCIFFVDDSNIWIEAQKFAASGNSHMPKLADSDRDPRLRIDIGRLVDALLKGRRQGDSFLYGSRPPPNDSVWKEFRKAKFKTKIYDRARGKEKEVDNSMATDLSSIATELRVRAEYDVRAKRQKDNTTFVAITGDRDMLPALRKVLESNIHVELWAWDSGMSTEYLKLDAVDGLLSVNFLNWIFDEISFTNFRSTRRSEVDPGQSIVLCEFSDTDVDNLEASISAQLIELRRLFYTTQSQSKTVMFVEFPMVRNIEAMVLKARTLFGETMTVLSWPEYASRFDKEPPAMVETSNMYAPLMNDKDRYSTHAAAKNGHKPVQRKAKPSSIAEPQYGRAENEEEQGLNDPDDNDGWQMAAGFDRRKRHGRALLKSQPCPGRIHCKNAGDCGFYHNADERSLFQNNPGQDFRLWKTRECRFPYCRRGKQCPFAHTRDEAWCCRCQCEGHYVEECRYRRIL